MRGHGVACWTLSFPDVVVLDVPVDVVAHACPAPAKIDGIGEATYILGRDLEKVRIVEAMEYVQ